MILKLFALLAAPSAAIAVPRDAPMPPTPPETFLVVIRYDVDVDGRAKNCVVESSTAPPGMGDASCKTFVERARFKPELDGSGRPIKVSQTMRLRWVLPK